MSISATPIIEGGKMFHSNDKLYLSGMERGIEFANEGALTSRGIHASTKSEFKFMLIIEDHDEHEIEEEIV